MRRVVETDDHPCVQQSLGAWVWCLEVFVPFPIVRHQLPDVKSFPTCNPRMPVRQYKFQPISHWAIRFAVVHYGAQLAISRNFICMNTTSTSSSSTGLPFADRLTQAVRACRAPVVVGLDPRVAQLPACLTKDGVTDDPRHAAQAIRNFCCGVVDVVASLVPAVKPQAAFFEQLGPAGMQALADVIAYARDRGVLTILDAKRGDIGSTAEAYADAYLGPHTSLWGADALTINPYLGSDSILPFATTAEQRGAGLFVLVKTSNPGGGEFQDLVCDGLPVYEHVGRMVERMNESSAALSSCGYGVLGAVVGATYPEQLVTMRGAMPRTWLLVPGFGSQGGRARDVAGAMDANGLGAIVNSSRDIIFAYRRSEYRDRFGEAKWQSAVEAATRDMIDSLRADTTAGRL